MFAESVWVCECVCGHVLLLVFVPPAACLVFFLSHCSPACVAWVLAFVPETGFVYIHADRVFYYACRARLHTLCYAPAHQECPLDSSQGQTGSAGKGGKGRAGWDGTHQSTNKRGACTAVFTRWAAGPDLARRFCMGSHLLHAFCWSSVCW